MTDDDREELEPEASAEDAGDPVAAFEALRRTIEKQGHAAREQTIPLAGSCYQVEKVGRIALPADLP